MKSLYWRPRNVSRMGLTIVAALSVAGLMLVHLLPVSRHPKLDDGIWMAASKAESMLRHLKSERLQRGLAIDPVLDPAATGLVGASMSPVTSRPSELTAKRTSVNPNFAAVAVDLLWQAGVRPGDTVAIGWTGSFPALNVALCAAVEALELRPVIVASATSSQYGANLPDFLWLDMERSLREAQLTKCQSTLVSYGGVADRGLGMPAASIELIEALAARNQVPVMRTDSRRASVDEPMQHYADFAASAGPVKAYINVGGGVASLGGEAGRAHFRGGLNHVSPANVAPISCVMARYTQLGTPVIHLGDVEVLAAAYQLPLAPDTMPSVGAGRPFQNRSTNRWLAVVVLVGLGLSLHFGVLHPGGSRIRTWYAAFSNRRRANAEPTIEPQLMV